MLYAILQKIKENGDQLNLAGEDPNEVLRMGYLFCKNLISKLPNSTTETLSESIHLMTSILIHFEKNTSERDKQDFLNEFIFKGLEMSDNFEFFQFSLECYMLIA